MFDLMVACHEISSDDVARFRHSVAVAPAIADTAAVAVRPAGLQGDLAVAEPSSGSAVADSPLPKAQRRAIQL